MHSGAERGGAIASSFYHLAPEWARPPAGPAWRRSAAVIASQAVITGAFSVDPAGDPAWPTCRACRSSTPPPHGSGADLPAVRELDRWRSGRGRPGGGLQEFIEPFGGRLRHRGHRHHDHRHHCCVAIVAVAAVEVEARWCVGLVIGTLSCWSTWRSSAANAHQGGPMAAGSRWPWALFPSPC